VNESWHTWVMGAYERVMSHTNTSCHRISRCPWISWHVCVNRGSYEWVSHGTHESWAHMNESCHPISRCPCVYMQLASKVVIYIYMCVYIHVCIYTRRQCTNTSVSLCIVSYLSWRLCLCTCSLPRRLWYIYIYVCVYIYVYICTRRQCTKAQTSW